MAGKQKKDYDPYDIAVGKVLKRHRTAIGKTQQGIAKHFGRSLSWYNDIERGKNAISWKHMLEMCDYFGMTIVEMTDEIKSIDLTKGDE